ncbi:MAG: sulfotransferase [Micavibrio sp.]|nr:sulfotransferase [Micavibrio sp.]
MKKNTGAPAKAEVLYRQAIAALSAGRLPEGIQILTAALKEDPSSGDIHNDLATAYWQAGQVDAADAHFTTAVRLSPKNAKVLGRYGAFLLQLDRLDDAEKFLKRAEKIAPENGEVVGNIGLLLYRRRDYARAEQFLRHAVKLNPSASMLHTTLGNVLRDTDRPKEARKHYGESVRLNPQNADGWRGVGQTFFSLHQDAEAISAFRKALHLRPKVEKTWHYLLSALERNNQLEEYAAALAEAERHFPGTPVIALAKAKMFRRQKKYPEAIACLETLLAGVRNLDEDCKVNFVYYTDFWFELAMLYDRVDNPEKAFACYLRGKETLQLTADFKSTNSTTVAHEVANYIEKLKATPHVPPTAELPVDEEASRLVFLVGFPRSGTTLLDQILSSHPMVTVAEEKQAVGDMGHRLLLRHGAVTPETEHMAVSAALEPISEEELQELRQVFFSVHGHAAMKGRGSVFVDKLPLNLMQALLIQRVFPEAKFILALRHPCDSVFSCFMQNFEMNTAMVRFMDINEGAKFYAEAFTIWDLIRSKIKIDAHATYYEDVVSDFKPTVTALLEFLKLEWTDAVLDYDETARKKGRINTPSYHQVTEKIYTRASGRWLRYKKQLHTILPVLRPYAEKHGYDGAEFDEADA